MKINKQAYLQNIYKISYYNVYAITIYIYIEPLKLRTTFSGPTSFNKNAGIEHSLW